MRPCLTLLAVSVIAMSACGEESAYDGLDPQSSTWEATAPVKIILDTDMASDCDDAGALAMLHAFADNGEADIVGVMVSTGGPYGAPAVDVINTFYGRPNIPIGTTKRDDFWVQGSSTSQPYNYEVYNKKLAQEFPRSLESGLDAPDAVSLYRQLLAQAADNSIVIVTIGPLINVEKLLKSSADAYSSLNGVALIEKKVKALVATGGNNPSGTSSNFSKEDAEVYLAPIVRGRDGNVATSWPGRIIWVGNNTAGDVRTSFNSNELPASVHPARRAYQLFFAANGGSDRASWDQGGIWVAIRGTSDGLFGLVETGFQTLVSASAGTTRWSTSSTDPLGLPAGTRDHAYSTRVAARADVAAAFNAMMNQPPGEGGEPPDDDELSPNALVFEAEAAVGQSAFAPFRVVQSANEGGGAYIDTAAGAGDYKSAPPVNRGRATFGMRGRVAGTHRIWLRVRAVQGGTYDSFYAQVGSGAAEVVNEFPSDQGFEWVPYKNVTLSTSSTTNLSIILREERTRLDQIIVTPDTSFVPSGVY